MKEFIKKVDVRWSDLDPNVHLRHSVYYDWGAFCRVAFFQEHQLTPETMAQLRIDHFIQGGMCVQKGNQAGRQSHHRFAACQGKKRLLKVDHTTYNYEKMASQLPPY
jgi:acyl-CoA thioester hydrolase